MLCLFQTSYMIRCNYSSPRMNESVIPLKKSLVGWKVESMTFMLWFYDYVSSSQFLKLKLDSQSDSSSATSNIVREARQQVLNYCKASAKDYKCIFTSGATAALKLVGEAFPWSQQSSFVYTVENHNSVLGIREYALDQGAIAFAIDIEDTDQGESGGAAESIRVSKRQIQRRCESRFLEKDQTGEVYNLFAFPSECNFSGSKLSLELVKIVKENSRRILGGSPFCDGQWMVLIDAAKGCATEPPDLSKYPADFVVISFYKLFGYPTGLGALIIRTDAAKLLKKTYFSGGTVAASIADIDYVKRREGIEELFEDGTASFLSIASIHHGFKILNSLTAPAISRHTTSIAMYLRKVMLALRHENGASICTIYGNYSKAFCNDFGPIVSFNLKRPDGSWFGYREVEKLASLSGIQLRTGCFCNPGACAKYLGLSHLDLLSNIEAGHVCWDDYDVVKGKPTGAVRVSFGYMSTYEDAKKFIEFLTSYFVPSSHQTGNGNILISRSILPVDEDSESRSSTSGFCLKSITVYPIKSCAGFSPDSWPMSNTGLKHDREWLLRSLNGQVLTQKKVPEMCFVSTLINMEWGVLSVESPCCKERLQINLKSDFYDGGREEMHLHGQKYYVQGYDDEVNNWFSTAIGQQCTLLRCFSSDNSLSLDESKSISTCRDARSLMNFSNEAQLLLISEDSVSDLNSRIRSNLAKGPNRRQIQVSSMRFRPNLVVSGGQPYDEDGWRILRIGNMFFTSVGGCNRCQMINFVHEDGQVVKSKEPLSTLALYRRMKGKILFGILLRYEGGNELKHDDESWLQVGDGIYPNIGP